MVPFGVPTIVRHLLFEVPKKGQLPKSKVLTVDVQLHCLELCATNTNAPTMQTLLVSVSMLDAQAGDPAFRCWQISLRTRV